MFHEKNYTRCGACVGVLLWWSCHSPASHSYGLLNHPNNFHRGIFKLNAKFDADSLLYSLNHFECYGHTDTCSFNGIYQSHWLGQWRHHCSHMHILVHSPWLPGYINITQTILIVTIAGLFLDRPCIYIFTFYFLLYFSITIYLPYSLSHLLPSPLLAITTHFWCAAEFY